MELNFWTIFITIKPLILPVLIVGGLVLIIRKLK